MRYRARARVSGAGLWAMCPEIIQDSSRDHRARSGQLLQKRH
ncbi:hypothetical protein I542_0748 [Mycobacteroides abscessus 1948]|uniref:Uncharacterized protein n=1 Tax=Mycobacteroides abscessus 1948 TaxID=1299323 RepID=A0A829QCM7_9MYCO|nr:hypothetical protein MA6G1108_2139 [Mycobacteroides abscessus 6G-1108]EIU93552.1 hypothetical protein MA6G0212_2205 [Mycobacteroides abscessus 6G-0212]ETZ60476.1 hypothetical protein L836_1894 [Mycobacteroides abscessus MAB_110811_2726]EUA60615.1 hypothetical protein I542_0748 [Mycobacteroides abscessus 1948]EUA76793.1 hypothetical protein I544_4866 [Mycobacteroides abscessus subsp. bolletii 103]